MSADVRRIVGIDTGGTFTDFVLVDDEGMRVHKVPSTPDNPARAVLEGLRSLVSDLDVDVVHGSTVATNALLERKGARTALVTTEGFEDVIEIGRQTRRSIYDLQVGKEPPLVSSELRAGAPERIGPKGEVLRELTDEDLETLVARLAAFDAEAVAVCLLHAYANPEHEKRIVDACESRLDAFCTSSSVVLPEFREFERCCTTAVNAYVGPVMARYLGSLAHELTADRVRIMQSNGGTISLDSARRLAVQTILSGPAGGAVGGFEVGRRAGFDHVITFDMGGTSTDVSLCPGGLHRTPESTIGETPIRVPVIDIHTVGAGGGSIAYRDPGGSLRVGPESAGADPGPICYGRGGTRLTVTDANLFLGRLAPKHFLGGELEIPVEPVRSAMHDFAAEMALSPVDLADGILRVANATMERAIRVISLERGFDPRDFTLVCFGGAGAMHAADLARNLGIPRVVVPRGAGILSALGMLLADFVRDYSRTLLVASDDLTPGAIDQHFGALERQARDELRREGFASDRVSIERSLDMRYVGQGYELDVPMSENFVTTFHERHRQRYGYADPGRATEVVNVRVRAIGETSKPALEEGDPVGGDASRAKLGEWRMVFGGAACEAALMDRAALAPGNAFNGPALIVEYSTTTVVPPDYRCTVDRFDNLVMERNNAR